MRTKQSKENLRKFNAMYLECLDEDGNVKLCGRDKCIALIEFADKIEAYQKHGNAETGFMDIEKLKELYVSSKFVCN